MRWVHLVNIDFVGDVFSGDIKDIVFKRFYNIAVNVL